MTRLNVAIRSGHGVCGWVIRLLPMARRSQCRKPTSRPCVLSSPVDVHNRSGRFGDVCARMVMQWFFGQVQILGPVWTWTMRSAQNLTVTGFFSNPVRLRICVKHRYASGAKP
jgi:hypothetical protein